MVRAVDAAGRFKVLLFVARGIFCRILRVGVDEDVRLFRPPRGGSVPLDPFSVRKLFLIGSIENRAYADMMPLVRDTMEIRALWHHRK